MVSLAVTAATNVSSAGVCANSGPQLAAIGYALDYIFRETLERSYLGHKAPIVNISINSGGLGFNSAGQAEVNRLALFNAVQSRQLWYTPPGGSPTLVPYTGAFVTQSAGNTVSTLGDAKYATNGLNVCNTFVAGASWAYTAYLNNPTTRPNDGIMVVGAIHNDGRAVDKYYNRPFDGVYDSGTPALRALSDHSSNMGGCVDVWAPGNLIYSTWGTHIQSSPSSQWSTVSQTYSGSLFAGTQGWTFLSGR